jgi:hypothetical protein
MSEIAIRIADILCSNGVCGGARSSAPCERARLLAHEIIAAMREPPTDIAIAMSNHAANGMVDWRDLHEAMIDAAMK